MILPRTVNAELLAYVNGSPQENSTFGSRATAGFISTLDAATTHSSLSTLELCPKRTTLMSSV